MLSCHVKKNLIPEKIALSRGLLVRRLQPSRNTKNKLVKTKFEIFLLQVVYFSFNIFVDFQVGLLLLICKRIVNSVIQNNAPEFRFMYQLRPLKYFIFWFYILTTSFYNHNLYNDRRTVYYKKNTVNKKLGIQKDVFS